MKIAALMLATVAAAPDVGLSARCQALIEPVHRAYARIAAAQSRLAPAGTDRERLERMFDIDQAGREALERVDFAKLPAPERQAAQAVVSSEIAAHDASDQLALKAMTPAAGWFLPDVYGSKAAQAAFLIVQHATNDPQLMRTTLVKLEPLAREGKIDGGQYALMYDRVALEFDHKLQRYGSQVTCTAGRWGAGELEDPARLDERRRAVGLKQTEAQYLAFFKSMPCR